jgi:hypothetical protein
LKLSKALRDHSEISAYGIALLITYLVYARIDFGYRQKVCNKKELL